MDKRRIADEVCAFIVDLPEGEWHRLTIKWLASRFGFSRSYLSRVFHREMRMPLGAFIHGQRLWRAERLLSRPSRGFTVKELAERVGFSDTQHFISCFKQRWGETPGRYRRSASRVVDARGLG